VTVLGAALVSLLLAGPAPADKVIDVHTNRAPVSATFENLWGTYTKAQQKGDT